MTPTGVKNLLFQCKHYDGYEREAALRKLAKDAELHLKYSSLFLPCVIERLNDWVPQVRLAARDAFEIYFVPEHCHRLLPVLPELQHLRYQYRGEHRKLVERVEALLLAQVPLSQWLTHLKHTPSHNARICFALLEQHGGFSLQAHVELSFQQTDPMLRLRAFQRMDTLPFNKQQYLAQQALRDSFMPLRWQAFYWLLERQQMTPQVLKNLLWDDHRSLRTLAIEHLSEHPSTSEHMSTAEIYATYLNKLHPESASGTLQKALWAVAYFPSHLTPALQESLPDFLEHPKPKVRKQALSTLCHLADSHPVELQPLSVRALKDRSLSVAIHGARWSRKKRLPWTAPQLLKLLSEVRHQKAIFYLLPAVNKWESLLFLLQTSSVFSGAPLDRALNFWLQRFNRSGYQPTVNQQGDLRQCWPQHGFHKHLRLKALRVLLRGMALIP